MLAFLLGEYFYPLKIALYYLKILFYSFLIYILDSDKIILELYNNCLLFKNSIILSKIISQSLKNNALLYNILFFKQYIVILKQNSNVVNNVLILKR